MLSRFSGNNSSAIKTVIEDLESRQMMAATPVVTGIKIAKASVNGIALNQNRITIAFSSAVRLGSTAAFRSFGYANDLTTTSGQRKVTVGLTITQLNSTVLQIITDRLVRKGSRLTIAAGGLSAAKGGTALIYDASTTAKTISFVKGQNKPRFTLSNRAFHPTDLSFVSPAVFTGAPTPTTVGSAVSSNTVATNLNTFLAAKVSAGLITAAQKNSAMATFNASATIGIIGDANLRAALVSLIGTVAAPAIDTYLSKANVTGKTWAVVTFSSSISPSAPTAETKLNSTGRLQTIVRPTLQGESFIALSAILAREALHQSATTVNSVSGAVADSQDAEIIDNAVANTVYAQQLLVDPTVAGNATVLTTYLNTQLIALLNSGQKLFPYGGIGPAPMINSPGNVFVGGVSDPGGYGNSTPVVSFADFIRRDFVHRGGVGTALLTTNPYAQTVLKNILGSTANVAKFDTTTQDALDTSNTILTDATYIKLAHLLKLNF